MNYVSKIPETLPPGEILVHNSIRPAANEEETLGLNGFRAWIEPYDSKKHIRCRCRFAGLNCYGHPHYRRVRKAAKAATK